MEHNHKHKHIHGGGHSHNHTGNRKALIISFFLISIFMIVEFVGGYLTNSLALLSDAGHMLSDAVALGLSLGALLIGTKSATKSKTYGFKRFEILAAMLNGVVLIVISIYIFKEAIDRLSSPPDVIGKGMMIISTIGLIINIIVAYVLHSQGSTEENLNLKSAYLHVIGDLLGSVGAIIAAVLILCFEWYLADPIASMIVSVLVLYSGWSILRSSVNILMESTPEEIETTEVVEAMKNIKGVKAVHDLHIWMITSEFPVLTTHLLVDTDMDRDSILEDVKHMIAHEFGINHVTIQLEGRELCRPGEDCCTQN